MSETETSTIRELEEKLRALEVELLGKTVENSPFTPLPSIKRQLAELKKLSESVASSSLGTAARLPPVTLPSFDGQDLEGFLREVLRWLRLSQLTTAEDQVKLDWLYQACTGKVKRILDGILEKETHFESVLERLAELFPKVENTISVRQLLQKVPPLPYKMFPADVEQMFLELETLFTKIPAESMSQDEKLLLLVSKINAAQWKEIRAERSWRKRCETYEDLKTLLREKARDDYLERFLLDQVQKKERTFYMESQGQNYGKGYGKGKGWHANEFQSQEMHFQLSEQGKGKGKGRGRGEPNAGKGGKGKGEPKAPEFKAKIVCKFCKKTGHYESNCWSKEKAERKQKADEKKKKGPQNTQGSSSNSTPQEETQKKRQFEEINLLDQKKVTWYLDSKVGGKKLDSILDTGATISAVSSRFTQGAMVNPMESTYIKVGNGEIIQSLGTTNVEVDLGECKLLQKVHVVDTNAFQCVLGTDFLRSGPVNGFLVNPPRLVVENKTIPMREEPSHTVAGIFRVFVTENYKLREDVRERSLAQIGVKPQNVSVDLFATAKNSHETLFCSKGVNCAWSYAWDKLTKRDDEVLWANPPFSKLTRTLTKIALEKAKVAIITPDWGFSGPNGEWRRLLDRLTVKRVVLPDLPLYEKFGDKENLLPKPLWSSLLSLVDGSQNTISELELDPSIVKLIKKKNRGYDRMHLEGVCLPKPSMEQEVELIRVPPGSQKGRHPRQPLRHHPRSRQYPWTWNLKKRLITKAFNV